MSKKNKKLSLYPLMSVLFLVLPNLILAANENTNKIVQYDPDGSIRTSVGTTGGPQETMIAIARFGLGAIGAICVGFIIYAGFLYALARGEEGKIKKAKDIILYSSIGLAVTFGAYAIAEVVFNLAQ